MNILELKNILKSEEIYLNINNNIEILKIITKNNLFLNIFISNQMKNIMILF
jgi:hypothetical protein